MVWVVPGVQLRFWGDVRVTPSTITWRPGGLVVTAMGTRQGTMVYAGWGTEVSAKRGMGAVASANGIPAKGPPSFPVRSDWWLPLWARDRERWCTQAGVPRYPQNEVWAPWRPLTGFLPKVRHRSLSDRIGGYRYGHETGNDGVRRLGYRGIRKTRYGRRGVR